MRLNKTICFAVILLITLILITSCKGNKVYQTKITDFNLKSDFLKEFKITKTTESYDSKTIFGEKESAIVKIKKIENIEINEAENYINDNMFVIESMYRGISSPYPGALSNRIECEEKFKPKKVKNKPFDYYFLFATDRMTYGACSKDQIEYHTIMFFLFCEKTKDFFQIELFVSLDKDIAFFENKLKEISCS
jgi:hypothetical protein